MKYFEKFEMSVNELEQLKCLAKMGIEHFSKRIYSVEYGASTDACEKCAILTRILEWTED